MSTFSSPVKKARYEQVAPKWQAFDEENETFISFGEDHRRINLHQNNHKAKMVAQWRSIVLASG